MPDVTMPRLSDSMEEGTILKWLKSAGDDVSKGEELVEIETDKATMTYEADADGTLEIVADEGATLAIGEVIARIGDGGDGGGAQAQAERAPAAEGNGGRPKASPVARRIAREHGIDLSTLEGTGPGGRIVKADVDAAASKAGGDSAERAETP